MKKINIELFLINNIYKLYFGFLGMFVYNHFINISIKMKKYKIDYLGLILLSAAIIIFGFISYIISGL